MSDLASILTKLYLPDLPLSLVLRPKIQVSGFTDNDGEVENMEHNAQPLVVPDNQSLKLNNSLDKYHKILGVCSSV